MLWIRKRAHRPEIEKQLFSSFNSPLSFGACRVMLARGITAPIWDVFDKYVLFFLSYILVAYLL